MRNFISTAAAAALVASMATVPAFAQTGKGIGSVVNCDASGSRQANGAILGAIAGAVIGNNVSHSDSAPIIGAVGGAAAGSYIGCQQQRKLSVERGHGQHVATTNVNVRTQPSTSGGRVAQLIRGQHVKVFGYSGSWAHVDIGGDNTGWVAAQYLQPTGR